ncbi:DUF3772 domain-containing protein [Roseovarius salinarum]|uniref:DUF3772 domain-containing protein n=1 Tax=Roseovarius salinarum TaxID=1981892 RepID=UPI000C3202E5|nr:DUF3772 domain-containing protein [Roseovarius salinarum]
MLFRLFLALVLAAALVPLGPGSAPLWVQAQQAQQQEDNAGAGSSEIDYTEWEKTATRAEEAIEAGRASTVALEELRSELVNWRDRFSGARDVNESTIETVQSQLEALGPKPEEGGESPEIALQREQLERRLAELRAPVKRADSAHSRADGLIKGIDQIIRDRQTEELLELGPSPVNPVHWPDGVSALLGTLRGIGNEVVAAWTNPVQRGETNEALPAVLLLLAVGGVLLARGRRWVDRLTRAILRRPPHSGRWLLAFLVSTGTILLPFLGLYAVVEAIYASGLVGLRGDLLLAALVPAAAVYLLARWLALRIFPAHDLRGPPLDLDDAQRHAGRLYGTALGFVFALFRVLNGIADFADWSQAAMNVILFPVLVVAGLLLVRLARILLQIGRDDAADDTGETFRGRMARLLARALVILGIAAPGLAAVGYMTAAKALIMPSLLSLMLLAGLLVLQRMLIEVYALLSGDTDGAADSLIPVLGGFVLALLSMPAFALIWGARVADLTELWTRFTEGIAVGGTRISPTVFLIFAVVFALGYMLTRLVQGALRNTVLPKTRIDQGGQTAIVSGVGYVGIFLAAVIAITSAGIDLSSIAIVAGALSVGIGFGLQNIVSNFVSGIILLIERPISEGDWIEVGGTHGYVRDISVRSTRIETFDRSDVIVPNADLISGTVTNYTRGNTVGRLIVPVGVAYGSDTGKVEAILQEVAEAHPLVLLNPAPYVILTGFGDSALTFEIRAILRDINWVLNVRSDMNHEIARRFAEAGIGIPYPQRDIWLRNPETLRGTPEGGTRAPTGDQPARVPLEEADVADPDADGGDA